jgi:hypothetical protein
MKKYLFLIVCAILLINGNVYSAGLPTKLQALLLYKTLGLMKNIPSQFDIVILYEDSETKGATDLCKFLENLSSKKKIAGKNVSVKKNKVNFSDLASIESSATGNIIYYMGNEKNIENLIKISQKKSILTITNSENNVNKGVTLGFDLVGGKPKIFFNINSSKAEKQPFGIKLLKLSKVIK